MTHANRLTTGATANQSWRAIMLGMVIATALTGCDRDKTTPPTPQTSSENVSTSGPPAGLKAQSVEEPAAADRVGAPPVGGVEAGQAGGTTGARGAPHPSGGDGAASAPANAASN